MSADIRVTRLTSSVGARMEGVDLGRGIDEEVRPRLVAGMTDRKSTAILRFLYNHIATPDFVYRHHWNPGDIGVWDELVCLHLAPQDYHPHQRKVVRVTAGSVAPVSPMRMPTGV